MNGVLAVVAHPDDETLGCGGALALHSSKGGETAVLCLTCNPPSRKSEIINAVKKLGIQSMNVWDEFEILTSKETVRRIAEVIVSLKPKAVITHLPFDYHVDHRATYNLVKEAVEWAAHTTIYPEAWCVKRMLLMEVNTLIPTPHVLVDITSVFEMKLMALLEHRSQNQKLSWGYYRDLLIKKGELRGIQGGCSQAEAYIIEPLTENSPFFPLKASNNILGGEST